MPSPPRSERPGEPSNWRRVVDGFLSLAPQMISREALADEALHLTWDIVERGYANLADMERHLESSRAAMRFIAYPISRLDMTGFVCTNPWDNTYKQYVLAILIAQNFEHAETHFAELISDPPLNLDLLATQTGFRQQVPM